MGIDGPGKELETGIEDTRLWWENCFLITSTASNNRKMDYEAL